MVEGIAEAFGRFLVRHGRFFRTRTRDSTAVACRYLHGLAQAEDCTFEAMAAVVEDGCAQQLQHFISNSPWEHEPVVAQIGADADRLLGGKSDGQRHTPIDMRLYLPKRWIDDPARCDKAGIPEAARVLTSKSEHALDIVRQARTRGMRFAWVGIDAGYGKEPAFLRALNAMGEVFIADVHRDQRVWIEDPGLHVPEAKPGRGRPSKKQQAAATPVTVESLAKTLRPEDWIRCVLRDCTRGQLQVDIAHRRVWLWDGEEAEAHGWHLIVRREVGSVKTIKYSLSNAPVDTPLLRLAQMQGQRFWVERAFEDAKGECGLADYQALGWRSWHHHVTMVMLAMLFIAEQRVAQQPGLELLTPRDIVEMLKETLPRKPEGKEALIARINARHARRQGAIESRFRTQQKMGRIRAKIMP